MFGRVRVSSVLLATLLSALTGLAIAQDQQTSETEGQAGEAEGEVAVRRRAELSGPEQIAEGERIQQRGNQISRRISVMLDEARRERDIIRVTCLNDKLTQSNANLRIVEQRLESLQNAVNANDTGLRNHEFTVLTVIHQKLATIEQEANQCVGQDIYETGATRVITDIDPATPDDDPTSVPEQPGFVVPYIPPPASGSV